MPTRLERSSTEWFAERRPRADDEPPPARWRPGGAIKRLVGRLLAERATPARLGWAVAVGVVIGTTPFYGLHLAISILVATLFGLNRTVTYLAANISVPVFVPLLAFGSIQIGSRLLTGRYLPFELEAFRALDPWDFATAWILGSFVLGAALGAPAGLATYFLARVRRPAPPPRDTAADDARGGDRPTGANPGAPGADRIASQLEAAAERFREEGRFAFHYVSGKLTRDPVYRQLVERVPFSSPLIDVGCGRGQTAVALALAQPALEILGVDWDAHKIALARRAARDLPSVRFEAVDATTFRLPPAGTILLIDVLHYAAAPVQDQMLAEAARALIPGGCLYIREVDDGTSARARLTRWLERLACLVRLNRGATLCFRRASEYVAVLEAAGLITRVVPSSAELPLANVLIEGRRPVEPARP